MNANKWAAIALVAVGVAVFLFAPVAPMEFTVDMPGNGDLPTISDIKGGVTPLGWVVFAGAVAMIFVGVALWLRRAK